MGEGQNEGAVSALFGDRRMKGAALLLLLVLSTFFLIKTFVEAKTYRYIGSGTTATNTISVSGEGEVYAVPDIAQFFFSVTEEALAVSDAQTAATEKINEILAALREGGIKEADIQTTGYNIYPRYEYEQRAQICPAGSYCPPVQGERVLRGYVVTQTITVKVRDTAKAGDLLAMVGGLGAENVSGLTFTFDDDEVILAQAREKAIDDARAKAEELADALDVRLIRVVSFSEGGKGMPFYRGLEEMAVMDSAMGGAGAPAPEIPVGENKIVSNVTITYEIR